MHADSQEHSKIEVGSSRSFGLVFTAVFSCIGLYPLFSGRDVRSWALLAAALTLIVSLAYPRVLQPLNVLWFRFGMLLARVVNPIVMFLIYIITIVPIGLMMRLLGKDLLRRKLSPPEQSYWIVRAPPGPEPKSLEDQF